MEKNKRIEEIANDIAAMCPDLVNNGCGDLSCVTCLAKGFEQMGYRKQRWISVEERVPEKFTRVLCFYPEKDYGSKIMPGYTENDTGYFAEQWRFGAPSHWMPLPEPPKMKGGAE